jgi:hypothetical protein
MAVAFYHVATTVPATALYVMYQQFKEGELNISMEDVPDDPTWRRHLNYMGVRLIVEKLCMTHYAGNVIIYLLTGVKFRQEVQRIFHRCLPSSLSSTSVTTTTTTTAATTKCCGRRQERPHRLIDLPVRRPRNDSIEMKTSDKMVGAHATGGETQQGGGQSTREAAVVDWDRYGVGGPLANGNGCHGGKASVVNAVGVTATVTIAADFGDDLDDVKRDSENGVIKRLVVDAQEVGGGGGAERNSTVSGKSSSVDDDVERNSIDIKRDYDDDEYMSRDSGCATLNATDDSRRDSSDIKRDSDSV